MSVKTKSFRIKTKGEADILDITKRVERIVKDSKIRDGIVTVFVPGSTGGITTIEYEPGLLKDLPEAFDRIAPRNINYAHNLTWGDGNGYSHVRAALLGASFVAPFSDQEMILGTWQQIVLVDFDNRPRDREIIVQVMGE